MNCTKCNASKTIRKGIRNNKQRFYCKECQKYFQAAYNYQAYSTDVHVFIVNLQKEISVVITRFGKNQYEIYNPIENIHENQILKYSIIPAVISNDIKNQAIKWAEYIVENLDYTGTLCVEYFIDKNNKIYANEIAPRVHNSGHLTINAYNISQFENHVRAVCNLDQLETRQLHNARMINLIGEDILEYRNKKLDKNIFFYDYLKKEIKNMRKMGHVTIIE